VTLTEDGEFLLGVTGLGGVSGGGGCDSCVFITRPAVERRVERDDDVRVSLDFELYRRGKESGRGKLRFSLSALFSRNGEKRFFLAQSHCKQAKVKRFTKSFNITSHNIVS
jgi:hypothetical protein